MCALHRMKLRNFFNKNIKFAWLNLLMTEIVYEVRTDPRFHLGKPLHIEVPEPSKDSVQNDS